MSTPAPASIPSTAPLATAIQPPTVTTTLPAGTQVLAAGHLLNDADALYAANVLGLGKDLGLAPTAAAAPATTPLVPPSTAPAPALETPAPGAPVPEVKPPVPETPEQELIRLRAELAAAKEGKDLPAEGREPAPGAAAAAPPTPTLPAVVPTADNPLANLRTADQFTVSENAARALRDWAFANRDGGTLPANLVQLAENAEAARTGRAPVTLPAQPVQIDADTASGMFGSADRMLTQLLPKRQEFVRQESALLAHVAQTAPAFLDTKKPEGELFAKIAAAFPELRGRSEWPLIVRDLVTGYLANNKPAAPAAPAVLTPAVLTVPDETGKLIPFAGGGAPIGGVAPATPPATQRQIDDSYARLRAGKATDEDLSILGAAAV